MEKIDKLYTRHPYYGSRRMVVELGRLNLLVNRKKVSRLMKKMGIEANYQKPNLSKANKKHKKYPYLLKGVVPSAPNQVWSRWNIYPFENRLFISPSHHRLV